MKMFLSGLARDLGEHGEHTVEEVRPQGLGHHGETPAHLGDIKIYMYTYFVYIYFKC